MISVALILILAAAIVFIIATFPTIPSRINLVALGLALLTIAIFIDRFLPFAYR